jgi:hypothetical protein
MATTILTGRAGLIARIGHRLFARSYVPAITRNADPAQPTMHWWGEARPYRSQPRDGRGRFLSKTWLAEAELFLPADVAWFRHPVSEER